MRLERKQDASHSKGHNGVTFTIRVAKGNKLCNTHGKLNTKRIFAMAKKPNEKLNNLSQDSTLSDSNQKLDQVLEQAAIAKIEQESTGEARLPDEISVKDYQKFIQSMIDKKEIVGTSSVSVDYTAKKNAEQSMQRSVNAKIVATTAVFLVMLMLIVYLLAMLLLSMGNFSVEVDSLNPDWSLSLSKDQEFSDPSNQLQAEPIREMRDTSLVRFVTSLDLYQALEDLQKTDDQEESDQLHVMLNTFYVRNDSDVAVKYRWEITVTEEEKDLGRAIRIMVIKNAHTRSQCEYWIFAKANDDGTQPMAVESDPLGGNSVFLSIPTINFVNDVLVARIADNTLGRGRNDTYTVILWIEGSDVHCDQSRLGGTLAVAMTLTIEEEA